VTGLDYHVIGLVPGAFDLDTVVDALAVEGYSAERLATSAGRSGFRVVAHGGWGVSAWLEDDDEARELNATLAAGPLPAGVSAEDVARRPGQLSIWSDDDDELEYAHVFEEVIEFLQERFGALLWDDRLGEWR
jgi:hypothetical protein